jgi:hypothetical protein
MFDLNQKAAVTVMAGYDANDAKVFISAQQHQIGRGELSGVVYTVLFDDGDDEGALLTLGHFATLEEAEALKAELHSRVCFACFMMED